MLLSLPARSAKLFQARFGGSNAGVAKWHTRQV